MAKTSASPTKKVAAAKPVKEVKAKKVKDPDAPKRPPSAFIVFSVAKRPQVVAENPGASFGEVGKLLGAMWAKLDERAKEVSLLSN